MFLTPQKRAAMEALCLMSPSWMETRHVAQATDKSARGVGRTLTALETGRSR